MRGGEPRADTRPVADLADTVLAEFGAMRDEITRRSEDQRALLALNFTVVGVIAAIVFSKDADDKAMNLLFILPFLCSTLGMIWLDHHRRIRQIGDFVRDTLRPVLVAELGDDRVLLSELEADRRERDYLLMPVWLALAFLIPSIVAFGVLWAELGGWKSGLWWLEIIVVGYTVVMWVMHLPLVKRRQGPD